MKSLIKILIKSQLAISLLLILSQPLKGESNAPTCSVYGKVGQIMSEVLLPMTMKDLIQFINGSNPEMEQEIVLKLVDSMTGKEFLVLNEMNEEDRDLLFEVAGNQAMDFLMKGQAETPEAVREQLYQQCTKEGFDDLIEGMRQ